jgi:hypothetical protein
MIRKQLARDRDTAFHDARRLALDLARGQSSCVFDPMHAGVVLRVGEIGYRQVPAMFNQLTGTGLFGWTQPVPVTVLVTDQRAFMRWPDGSLISLWWNNVHGFEAKLHDETLILDYGDGKPMCLSGPTTTVIAVAGIAAIYGVGALLRHPALVPLRVQVDARRVHHRTASSDGSNREQRPLNTPTLATPLRRVLGGLTDDGGSSTGWHTRPSGPAGRTGPPSG